MKKSYFYGRDINRIDKEIKELEIWDVHSHIGKDKDGMTSSLKSWYKELNDSNVDKAVAFALNDPNDQTFEKPNDFIFSCYKKYPKKLIPFFRINPKKEFINEFKKRIEQEFKGIKMHPRSQNFRISDEKAKNVYEMAEKFNIPILLHAGRGVTHIVEDIIKVNKEFKNLKIILGHAAFIEINNAKKIKRKKNIYFDLSAVRFFDICDIIHNIPTERILFGSDSPYMDTKFALESFMFVKENFNISKKMLEMMLSGNLKNILGVN